MIFDVFEKTLSALSLDDNALVSALLLSSLLLLVIMDHVTSAVTTDSFLIILISFRASRWDESVLTRILKFDVHLSQHCNGKKKKESNENTE